MLEELQVEGTMLFAALPPQITAKLKNPGASLLQEQTRVPCQTSIMQPGVIFTVTLKTNQ